ncbi:MAG: glycosyltransferase family 4 protein [Deferribacteres bacterium]|nr:glycosyltransferase family 4 protein [candidate division KSB1 bacterium]MCB9504261.1 glycosyltransferase family 4 protein [Deferribacteres bacterium]
MKIAMIVSMKYGPTKFLHRDVEALLDKNNLIKIFTLLQNKGLYNPTERWRVIPVSRTRVIFSQIPVFLKKRAVYLKLLREAFQLNAVKNFLIAVSFYKQIKDDEIIYAYFGDHKLFTGYFCKMLTGVPLVVSIRAYELYRNPNNAMFVKALAQCDRIVTITNHNKKRLMEHFGAQEDKIEIVRQIIELDKFKPIPKIKILIVGFFAEKKGHEVLFKAIKILQRDDIELWVVGDINRSIVQIDGRKLAEQIGIADRVAFFGEQSGNALRALYRECDIFCLPSRPDRYGDHEGFPNVIAEAMASGKPVVSTFHAGIPEAVDDFLVEENNAHQLAKALETACNSAKLRQEIGEKNRRRAETLFSAQNNDALQEILKKHARSIV